MDWLKEIEKLEGWHFGGKGSGIEDQLATLVCRGEKTATCSWYESYAIANQPLAEVRRKSWKSELVSAYAIPILLSFRNGVTFLVFFFVLKRLKKLEVSI